MHGDILARHAKHMINLAIHDRARQKRPLLDSWVQLDRVNREWIAHMCPVVNMNDEFHRATEQVVEDYTDLVGDYIISGNIKERDRRVNSLVDYYWSVSPHAADRESLRGAFLGYFNGVRNMLHQLDERGKEHENFNVMANECQLLGSLLGARLDGLFY